MGVRYFKGEKYSVKCLKVKSRVLISIFGVALTYHRPRAKIPREQTVIAALLHIIKIPPAEGSKVMRHFSMTSPNTEKCQLCAAEVLLKGGRST